ncbi:ECF subfamily RNA polymerase sigma factor [Caballeronia sordidicola]|uniref:ECF subfamily RNA polymerase sigma factor n=1 Tax=Caballeronia sordidicola TaxID=196367 RepID=A0A158H4D8_CABSO|nr:sigma-70 family RNA polymerase sigma factor [Caballeronia sordidicola]SAL39175.1 ECF subfamily RNA polymerase sigma factor [Caballeronia sordidicola]
MNVDIESHRDRAQLAIFEAARPRLFSLAYRILGVRADAEDVVQDTFVKWHLHQRASAADTLDTPAAWLTTVAKRMAIDRLRRKARDSRLVDEIDFLLGDNVPSAQALAERTSDLSYGMRRVFERLSAEERAAFLLREAFDEDYASIASILNRSAAHCRQIVHRAKDRVRDDRRDRPDNTSDVRDTVEPAVEPAIEPLLDAIARQDVHALVALTLAAAPATSASAHAAMLTRDLIARLRIGRIDLHANAHTPLITAPVLA